MPRLHARSCMTICALLLNSPSDRYERGVVRRTLQLNPFSRNDDIRWKAFDKGLTSGGGGLVYIHIQRCYYVGGENGLLLFGVLVCQGWRQ